MSVSKGIIWCLLWIALLGKTIAQIPIEHEWRVVVVPEVELPKGIYAVPKFEVTYPLPSDVSTNKIEDDDPPHLSFEIVPARNGVKRPSHVIVRESAFGFKTKTFNSGILQYDSGKATAQINFKMTVDGSVKLERVVRLQNDDKDHTEYEIVVFNPSQEQVNLTGIALESEISNGHACLGEFLITEYEVNFALTGTSLHGKLKDNSDKSKVAYDLDGDLKAGCGRYVLSVHSPMDYPIPPKDRAYFRLIIPESERRKAIEYITKQEHKGSFSGYWSGWEFFISINDSYVVNGTDLVENLPPFIRNQLSR